MAGDICVQGHTYIVLRELGPRRFLVDCVATNLAFVHRPIVTVHGDGPTNIVKVFASTPITIITSHTSVI